MPDGLQGAVDLGNRSKSSLNGGGNSKNKRTNLL